MTGKKLGEILRDAGVITEEQLREALRHQKGRRTKLGESLVELGSCDEKTVARCLAKQSGLPFVDLEKGRIPDAVIARVPAETARQSRMVPVMVKDGSLIVAVDDPGVAFALGDLEFVLNMTVQPALATSTALKHKLQQHYGVDPEPRRPVAATVAADEDDDAPLIRLVDQMVEAAYRQRASDIHVEPTRDRLRIRYRIDGVLLEVASHPKHLHASLASRLKIMAGMDIGERRKPQDGRIPMRVAGTDLDIRASVLPTNHGETLVMRLLDRESGLVPMRDLGFGDEDYGRFRNILARPHGIFLVTGPTGSGKTTTLYAALQELNRPDRKLITAEDPVEYQIPGINQVQANPRIGLSFAKILRAMLRQAPNVILVGEIRDGETAEVAIQAALTGHLVFSTLHTNDAPAALTRLLDMKVQPFLVAASVVGVMSQRLVRQLCTRCRQEYAPDAAELAAMGWERETVTDRPLYRPQGCDACHGTGYRGRTGVFELLEMDRRLKDMTFRGEPHARLRDEAIASGQLTPLWADACRKVLEGRTSVSEILRVVTPE